MRPSYAVIVALGVALFACEKRDSKLDQLVSAAEQPTAAPGSTEPRKIAFSKVPEISIDGLGAYVGGHRADLSKKDGKKKLAEIVSKIPIDGDPIVVKANLKTKISNVSAVVEALGAVEVSTVIILTDGRNDLPKSIRVTPLGRIVDPQPCSVATTITDAMATGVWSIRGGGGRRHTKGLAGPDLTRTGESMVKELAACSSKTAFFAANLQHGWELAFNMGALVTHSAAKLALEKGECGTVDDKVAKKIASDTLSYDKLEPDVAKAVQECAAKRVDKLVLLADEPVAGREVKIGG